MKKNNVLLVCLICLNLFSNAQKFVPAHNKTLLIIGQDLQSVYGYTSSKFFPTPGGITSYISLYDCANPNAHFPFGGLGETLDGTAAPDIDWGSGPLNTRNAALGYPHSTLAIGLYMTEEFFPNGLTNIASGEYDTEIIRLAQFIKSIDKPTYLRIGYEFDGNWNIGYENRANFKNAYKYIVDVIRPIAPKCEMVLQACTSPVDDIVENVHENIADWYPGDEYVDWLGLSWFLSSHPLQITLADEVLELARLHQKPVMVCESAPQGYDLLQLQRKNINTMLDGVSGTGATTKTATQIWNEWFEPFFNYIHTHNDVIKAVAYINCNWDSQAKWAPPYNEGYWGDTRVEAHAEITNKWLQEISTDFWLHGSEQLFDQLVPFPYGSTVCPAISVQAPSEIRVGNDAHISVEVITHQELISYVQFIDENSGTILFTDYSAPYSYTLNNLELGNYTLAVSVVTTEIECNKHYVKNITVLDTVSENYGYVTLPENGKTLLMVGQTYTQEYTDYVAAMNLAPAGSSHYAEIYNGAINQGDDGNNEAFLQYVESNYPGSYTMMAISIKDNPAAGGYSGPNASWQACVDIANGVWDSEIDALAASFKKRNIKFLVRIGYEVSLMAFANKTTNEFIDILIKYNDLGINPLERAAEVEEFDLEAYKNAYNYIAHRIRVVNNVDNVLFVYHPVRGISDAKNLYPGDEYVDAFALSFFNHDMCWPTWEGETPPFNNCPQTQEMDDNIKQCLNWARDSIKKPIVIAESAVQSHTTAQTSDAHKIGYLQKVIAIINQYDIKAWVYINSNWVAKGWADVWGDSRVESSSEVFNYWKQEVTKPRFIHYTPYTPLVEIQQSISLHKGWNLISTHIHVQDSSIDQMFATLNVQVIKNEDGFWNKYQDAAFNSLKTITAGKGYLVYMEEPGTVFLTGTPMQASDIPSVAHGWKLIGYPAQGNSHFAPIPISDYFNATNNSIIKNFDGFWQPNGTHNSLHNFEPGKGYYFFK